MKMPFWVDVVAGGFGLLAIIGIMWIALAIMEYALWH